MVVDLSQASHVTLKTRYARHAAPVSAVLLAHWVPNPWEKSTSPRGRTAQTARERIRNNRAFYFSPNSCCRAMAENGPSSRSNSS